MGFVVFLLELWTSSSLPVWAGCVALKTHTTSLFLFFFSFLLSSAGCGALNTHLAPFVFFSLLLLLLCPLRSFLLPPGGLRRPKYASRPFSSFLSFSLSPSFLLPFPYYFRLFLFARLGMACSWCRSSTSRCSFSTRLRRVSGLSGVLCPRR